MAVLDLEDAVPAAAKAAAREALLSVPADPASGFALKACIHPRQVPVVRKAFQPGQTQVAWARRVIAAARDGGVAAVDGQMIDAPLIRQAETILASLR